MTESKRYRCWFLLSLGLVLVLGLAGCGESGESGEGAEATGQPFSTEEPLEEEYPLEAGGQAAIAPHLIRTSFLTDLDVNDTGGNKIAEVEDALLGSHGSLRYLLIDTTPELGAEDPPALVIGWEAVTLEVAPGPVGRRLIYQGDLAAAPAADSSLVVEDDDYVIEDPAGLGMEAAAGPLIQLSDYDNFELLNGEGEDLGDVEEVIVDLEAGEAAYAIVEVGGFLDAGARAIAVPWSYVAFDPALGAYLVLVDRPSLEDAPAIDLAAWEYGPPTEDWNEEIDEYWSGVSVG